MVDKTSVVRKQINVTHILKLHMNQKGDQAQQHTIYLVLTSEQQIVAFIYLLAVSTNRRWSMYYQHQSFI